jgi:hypothetical protein
MMNRKEAAVTYFMKPAASSQIFEKRKNEIKKEEINQI